MRKTQGLTEERVKRRGLIREVLLYYCIEKGSKFERE